ncbi:MAG: ComEA family DNA-binding protein, partial [Lachnospiraceae bacterium]|nr:ComEA family DNA-binding protein [Lachnospiraceae bacterium]
AQGVSAQDPGLVNINTATVTELTTVSGIGASRAQAIVDYRERNGRFGSIDDIKKVDGIKDGLFSKIKDKITI